MKPIFPATYSTLSPLSLAVVLAERYLLDIIQCTFLVRGVGDTYLVISSTGRYVLRVYRSDHRNLAQIEAEVALLIALKQAGVSVSYPIADKSQKLIQQLQAVEGIRPAVLFSFAPGQPAKILTDSQLRTFGSELARFHQVSSTITLPGERWKFDLETTLFKPLGRLKSVFVDSQEDYLWLQHAARQVEKRVSHVDSSRFLSGYCHFDLLPKNMHFEGDSITFFDFDFMGYGWLVHDLASFWQHLAIEVYAGRMKKPAFQQAYAIFLESYQTLHPISEQELSLVPYLTLSFWLFYMSFHTTHDQFSNFLQPTQLKVFIGFLKHVATAHWD